MKMSRLACLVALLLMPLMGIAQEIDLWDTWRIGFEKYEAAEKEFKKKNMKAALKLYKESQAVFQKIRNVSPNWNKDVVAYRITLCERRIKSIGQSAPSGVVQRQLGDEIGKLQKEVQSLKNQLRQTRLQLIDARNAADRVALSEKQIRKLMTENAELRKKLAAQDATISSLRADLRRSDKSADFKRQLLNAKTDIEKLRVINERLKKDLEFARNRAQKFMDQRNAAESKLFRMEALLKELSAKKKEVDVLAGENRKLAAALNQMAERLKASEQVVAAVKKLNADLQAKVNGLESGTIVSTSEKKLREDLTAERQTITSLRAALDKLRTENQNLTTALAKLRDENKKVVLDLVKLSEVVAKLRGDNNKLLKLVEELNVKLSAAKNLAAENAELKKNLSAISKNFEAFRLRVQKETADKIKELNLALDNARVEHRFMAERLRRADENLKKSIAKLQQTIVKLEEEKAVLRQSLILARQEVGDAKGALDKLRLEYKALKDEFDALNLPKSVAVTPPAGQKPVAVTPPAGQKPVAVTPPAGQKPVAVIPPAGQKPVTVVSPQLVEDNKKLTEKVEKLTLELNRLKKDNAQYRVQLAAFNKLQKDIEELRRKLSLANGEIAKRDTEKAALMEKIRLLSQKVDEQIQIIKAAQETIARKDAIINTNTKDMQNVIALLKKQLAAAQKTETALRRELDLLKMEYADLEKKAADSVPKNTLVALRAQIARLDKELSDLRIAKAKTDAALKDAEALINQQNKRLAEFANQLTPDAKNQIAKLTAAVAELQEARVQYETLIGKLRQQVKDLNEDNKELKLANTSLRADIAELRLKPVELQKMIDDLKGANENLRRINQKITAQVQQLRNKVEADEKLLVSLRQDLAVAQNLAQRYRKELNDWGELPQVNVAGEIAKKDKAISLLVAENTALRNERDMLTTELKLSKDFVVKYKKLILDLNETLRMRNIVMARLQNALARFTSAADVEALVANVYESKKGEFGHVAPVGEILGEVNAIKKADAPKLTPEQIAERDAAYKTAMTNGLKAEKEKNYADALIQYWRATGLCTDANGAEVYKALARVYLARRDFVNARDNYKIAVQKYNLKRDPDFEDQLVILAQELADTAISGEAANGIKKDPKKNNKRK